MPIASSTDIWSAAGTVFIVVSMAILTTISVYEHRQRSFEHQELQHVIQLEMQQLVCTSKLNVFIQMQPKETQLRLEEIPSEYWLCMPRSLLPEKNKVIR